MEYETELRTQKLYLDIKGHEIKHIIWQVQCNLKYITWIYL